MSLVPDASAVISLAFDDEDGAYAGSVIDAIAANGALVPLLFWLEIGNALLMGERRNRATIARTTAFLADLRLMPIETDVQASEVVLLDLARRYSLTVYDAAYLDLAQRKSLPLATVDRALIAAAKAAGVVTWQKH